MWDIDGNEYIDYVGSCLLGDLRLLVMQMMRFCSFSLSSILRKLSSNLTFDLVLIFYKYCAS